MEKKGKYIGKYRCIKEYRPFQRTDVGSMIENNYYHLYEKKSTDNEIFFGGDTIQFFEEDDEKWIFTSAWSTSRINEHLIDMKNDRNTTIDSIIEN